MICNRCKQEIEPQNNFCPHCGNRVAAALPKEPGEIKSMAKKIRELTSGKTTEARLFLLTIKTGSIMALSWSLGGITDDQFLKFFEIPEEEITKHE